MLNIHNLSVSFQGEYLFEDITFRLGAGDRIGLIGKNGAGKSTMLKILSKEMEPDTGQIAADKNLSIGFLKQDIDFVFGTMTSFSSVIFDQDDFSSGCSLNNPQSNSSRPNMKFNLCTGEIDSTFDIKWSPSSYLDFDTIPSPLSVPQSNISYYVTITDGFICSSVDSLTIAVRSEMITSACQDTIMCNGASYNMSATGGYFYNWIK